MPLFAKDIRGTVHDIRQLYADYYAKGLVKYTDATDPDGLLSAGAYSGRDDMQVSVYGNEISDVSELTRKDIIVNYNPGY